MVYARARNVLIDQKNVSLPKGNKVRLKSNSVLIIILRKRSQITSKPEIIIIHIDVNRARDRLSIIIKPSPGQLLIRIDRPDGRFGGEVTGIIGVRCWVGRFLNDGD